MAEIKKGNTMKQALKIKLANHSEFQKAWDALIKLGYLWGGNCTEPCTAPYLYTYEDGRILADYFDIEGADLLSPNSALGYFNASERKEIQLEELIDLSIKHLIWIKAPHEAFHWERLPNSKCVWHCSINGRTVSKKAPNFEIKQNSLWRDADKQKQADLTNANITDQLSQFNIVLA